MVATTTIEKSADLDAQVWSMLDIYFNAESEIDARRFSFLYLCFWAELKGFAVDIKVNKELALFKFIAEELGI
jgi:hypothetical protein